MIYILFLARSMPIALRLSKEHKDHFRVSLSWESALTETMLISKYVATSIAIDETASIAKACKN